jgi:hypothetical protein
MKLIKEIRSKKGVLHFKRWRILKTPWFSIYIHGIYMHDLDPHSHNHPWKIWTMILKGGYLEKIESGGSDNFRIRNPGHMSYTTTESFHKIKRMIKTPTYTLAIVGKRTNELWGYKVDGDFIDHKKYRKR